MYHPVFIFYSFDKSHAFFYEHIYFHWSIPHAGIDKNATPTEETPTSVPTMYDFEADMLWKINLINLPTNALIEQKRQTFVYKARQQLKWSEKMRKTQSEDFFRRLREDREVMCDNNDW